MKRNYDQSAGHQTRLTTGDNKVDGDDDDDDAGDGNDSKVLMVW